MYWYVVMAEDSPDRVLTGELGERRVQWRS